MTLHDAEADERVFDGLGRAIRSTTPASLLNDGNSSDARIAAGITVYRNNVRAAYLRVLHDTFPVVHRLVGEEFFRYLAHEYFHAHPPSGPLVARYGRNLPEFLHSFDPTSALPYLPDVARLEIAWLASYHAAEARCLEPESVITALGEAPDDVRFQLHPSVQLIQSRFPAHTIWLQNKLENKEKINLSPDGEFVVIKRPAHQVFTETISESLWSTLIALQQGRPISEAIAVAVRDGGEVAAAEIIRKLATMNVITAVHHSG